MTDANQPTPPAGREAVMKRLAAACIAQPHAVSNQALPFLADFVMEYAAEAARAAELKVRNEVVAMIENAFNPSISQLEVDEHQGKERDVIYVDDIKADLERGQGGQAKV